jgi:O-antigen ligase
MLFAFVTIGRIQEVIPALIFLHVGLLTGGLAGLIWLLAPGSLHDKIPMRIPQVKYVVWLFLLSLLLVPVGVWPGNSLDFIASTYWKVVLFFLMVVSLVRSVVDLRRIIWVCCLGVTALVALGLAFNSPDVQRFEAGSLTYDPNDLAFVLVIALPLLIYLFSSSGLAFKLLAFAMMFVCLYGFLLTKSRGGFLALLVVGFLILSRSNIGKPAKVGIIALALVVFGSLAGTEYWDRISTIWAPQSEYDETAGGRTVLWKTGLQILATHPWGVGIDSFTTAEGLSHEGLGKWKAPHNSFLQIGVELGVAGLGVFILLLTSTLKELRRLHLHPVAAGPRVHLQQKVAPVAAALEVSLWGFMVGGFFLSQAYSGILYFVLALSLACSRIAKSSSAPVASSA